MGPNAWSLFTGPLHTQKRDSIPVFAGSLSQNQTGLIDNQAAFKDLSRVKAGFKSVPPQLYFEFGATFQHLLAEQIQNKVEEEHF